MVYTAMSGKKRERDSNKEEQESPLPLGTFSGTSIHRNRRHSQETFREGHVSIHSLLLPETHSALITTFVSPDLPWMQTIFSPSTNLTMVSGHDKQAPIVGHAQLKPLLPDNNTTTNNKNKNWLWMTCTPHTGGCLHPKLLLFRNKDGLRVVVSGNNFFQRQWEVDRDCTWIQDFQYTATAASECEFGATLTSFVRDLTRCQSDKDQATMQQRLQDLFGGIDFTPAKGRLVISFPRSSTSSSTEERGGYQHLARVVHDFYCELNPGSDCEEDSNNTSNDDIPEGSIMYATSGSFGNVQADFLLQMHEALACGREVYAQSTTPWDRIFNKVRCLWPSRETALTLNLVSLIGNTRPMPRSYWRSEIPEAAKRNVFYDALPNPPDKGDCEFHAVSHCKIMYHASQEVSVVYVGSHNFSKSAWGLRGQGPKNVELGVVLATTSPQLRQEWKSRLPCLLPNASNKSPASYIPASAHSGIRQTLERGEVEEAVKMTIEWLSRDERELMEQGAAEDDDDAKQQSGGSNDENAKEDSNVIKADVIDLCDSDS